MSCATCILYKTAVNILRDKSNHRKYSEKFGKIHRKTPVPESLF